MLQSFGLVWCSGALVGLVWCSGALVGLVRAAVDHAGAEPQQSRCHPYHDHLDM